MASEYRPEICAECGHDREREWVVKQIPIKTPVPKGWRVDSRSPSWKTISARTRWTTLCMCDAA